MGCASSKLIRSRVDGTTDPDYGSSSYGRISFGKLGSPQCEEEFLNESGILPSSSSSSASSSKSNSGTLSFKSDSSSFDRIPYLDEAINGRFEEAKSANCERKFFDTLDFFDRKCPPRGEGKAVLYFTSLQGIRKTYENSCKLRMILQGLGVYVDERDVWLHQAFRTELFETLGESLALPRLFIKGRHIGGAEEVEELHENGILQTLLQGLPQNNAQNPCDGCLGRRFVPCLTCDGSGKVFWDDDDMVSECPDCNENGLMWCPLCT